MILFRMDSSLVIGSGHVMRCLTLAREFEKKGHECAFACRSHKGNLIKLIRNYFHCYEMKLGNTSGEVGDLEHSRWLGVRQQQDADQLTAIINDNNLKVDLLVVDHYALDHRWEKCFIDYVDKIFVIDDLADRVHHCDFLLDQNYFKNTERYKDFIKEDTQTFLGPGYALLRDEFLETRKQINRTTSGFKKILIFFGGVDLYNMSMFVLKNLLEIQEKIFEIDIVSGVANPNLAQLKQEVEKHENVTLHTQVNYMAELMAKADVSIGAGGATNWERLCLGLPSIVISLADNQVQTSKDLHEDGLIYYLGHYDCINGKVLLEALNIFERQVTQQGFTDRIMSVVDGIGAEKIVNAIEVA